MSVCAGLPVLEGSRRDPVAPTQIAWLASRSEYWPTLVQADVRGVACLLFGIGAAGTGWLDRLARSEWFAGLEPRADDLAEGETSRGGWAVPAGAAGDGGRAVEALVASAALPRAWYASVAIPPGTGSGELSAALGLVAALQGRRDPLGRRLTVVVTVEAARIGGDAFVRRLRDRGAFVVRAGLGAAGDHLHHTPLRAQVQPRWGRLICVDFADYLHTWRPGRVADLHVIPAALDAALALCRMPVPASSVRALNLGFHLGSDPRADALARMDEFAELCRRRFLGPDGDMVFTNADRLDGEAGPTDLLVIYEATAGHPISWS